MFYDIKHYVRLYEGFLDPAFCRSTINSLTKVKWEKHKFYQAKNDYSFSYDDDLSMTWEDLPEREAIQKKLWLAIQRYILSDFSFCAEWFAGWNGYTPIRFNRYDVSTQMKIHCDHIQSMFDGERKGIPTLSIVGTLNDDYEGGDFVMWDEKINLPTGALLIFPSNFMFPHKVTTITKGVRYSYVSWVW